MSAKNKYQVWWSNDRGQRIMQLDDLAFINYTRVVNGIGTCNIGLPYKKYGNIWKKDYRIEVYRRPTLEADFRLENIFFMLEPVIRTRMEDNVTILDMSGHDANTMLARRIVKYKAGNVQAKKSGAIDDMMKEIVDENMGAAAYADDADRAVAYHNGFFRVQADSTSGSVVDKSFAYREVLGILKELGKLSVTLTPEIYFDIVPVTNTIFEFRTYANQRGADRRFSAGKSAFYFSLERGNIEGPSYEYDTFEEKNVVYVAGRGTDNNREVIERENADLVNLSVWARTEGFADARNVDLGDTDELNDVGDEFLGENEPDKRFVANFLDAKGSRYGVDWDFGDRVTANYGGILFDIMIKQVQITLEDSGSEKIFGRNEYGEFGG